MSIQTSLTIVSNIWSWKTDSSDSTGGYCELRTGGGELGRRQSILNVEKKGYEVFAGRLESMRFRGESEFDIEEVLEAAIPQKYKGRWLKGRLLHYALWKDSQEGDENANNAQCVLDAGALPESTASYTARYEGNAAQVCDLQAIHLVCNFGYVAGIDLLLGAKADINAMTLLEGDRFYAPIHEAIFARQEHCLKALLRHGADMTLENSEEKNPLHMAAWVGHADIVQQLVRSESFHPKMLNKKARFHISSHPGPASLTPLQIATEHPHFPSDRLLMLAPFRYGQGSFFEVIRMMAKTHPCSTVKLMNSFDHMSGSELVELKEWIVQEAMCRTGRYSAAPESRDCTVVGCMAEIIDNAPDVAEKILHLLCDVPFVDSDTVFKHPLPQTAMLWSHDPVAYALGIRVSVRCSYQADYSEVDDPAKHSGGLLPSAASRRLLNPWFKRLGAPTWKLDFETGGCPAWHKVLAPKPPHWQRRAQANEVKFTVLQLPNCLDIRILHALKAAGRSVIAGSCVVEALCMLFWRAALPAFYVNLVWEVVTLALLADRAVRLQEGDARVPRSFLSRTACPQHLISDSLIFAKVVREFFGMVYVPYQFVFYLQRFAPSFADCCSKLCYGVPSILLAAYLYFVLEEQGEQEMAVNVHSEEGNEDGPVWIGRRCHLFLIINVFIRCVVSAHMLCVVGGIGEAVVKFKRSLFSIFEMLVVAMVMWMTLGISLLSIRGEEEWSVVLLASFSAMFRADTNRLPFLEDLDKQLFCGYMGRFLMMVAAILFNLCFLNLLIGVYSSIYANLKDRSRLLFVEARFSFSEWYLLEAVWPSDDDANTSLPYCLTACMFVAWFVSISGFLSKGMTGKLPLVITGMLLAVSQLMLQAVLMRNPCFNMDIKVNGLERTIASTSGTRDSENDVARTVELQMQEPTSDFPMPRCLWICHRHGPDVDEEDDALGQLQATMKRIEQRLDEKSTDSALFRSIPRRPSRLARSLSTQSRTG